MESIQVSPPTLDRTGPKQHPSASMARTEATVQCHASSPIQGPDRPERGTDGPTCLLTFAMLPGVPGSGQPLPYPRVQSLGWRAEDPARWVSEAQTRCNSCGFYISDTGAYLPHSRHLRQISPHGQGVGGQMLSLLSGPTGRCGPAWELQPRPGQPPTEISSDSNFSFSLSLSPHLLPCP